ARWRCKHWRCERGDGVRRREALVQALVLLGGAAAWPLTAHGQESQARKRLGILLSAPQGDRGYEGYMTAFREGLGKLRWTERRNIRIDYRWGALDAQLRRHFAQELLAMNPDVILTQNTPTTQAVLQQTRSVPIVFAAVSDPVGSGFVAGLPRPGGNVTGFID